MFLLKVWSSYRQVQHGEVSLQVTELEEKILKPHRTFLSLHPAKPLRKAGVQATSLLGTGATEGLSLWCNVPSFRPCCVHTYDPWLKLGPHATKWAMKNKVATQLFGLFPDDHDSWQLRSASRDRTCGGDRRGEEKVR